MSLTHTVRGNKKLCFHLESAWVSAHTQDMLQWSEKLQDTTPSNFTITGPGCCRLLKQLPQGDQSNLVYTSLSIHSSNLAQVITTSLSSPKSSPKVLSQKATFGSARHLDSDWNKHSISMPRHFLDRLMFVLQVSVTQRSLLTQNTSVTLTHICRTGPTHSITAHGWSLSLNVPPHLERTNKSSDLPLICSLPSARAAVNSHIKDKHSIGELSISTASCFHHSGIGTGQRDTLQLEMETWGLCPWHVPAAPQKKCEHTFLTGKRTVFLPVISAASSRCCSYTSWSQTISRHAVSFHVRGAACLFESALFEHEWPAKLMYVYTGEMCVVLCSVCLLPVWKCFLRVGGLWYASLVGGFHQQKSIPLYSAATIQQLVWGVGPASCLMHLHAAWTQSADAQWELLPSICIVFTPLHEVNQFAAIVRLIFNQRTCERDRQKQSNNRQMNISSAWIKHIPFTGPACTCPF